MNEFTTADMYFVLFVLVLGLIVHIGMQIVCRLKSNKIISTKKEVRDIHEFLNSSASVGIMSEDMAAMEAFGTHPNKRTSIQHFMVAMSY